MTRYPWALSVATSFVCRVLKLHNASSFWFQKAGQYRMFRFPPLMTKALAALAGRSHGQNAPEQSGNRSRLSSEYIRMASPNCLMLLAHFILMASVFAFARAGNNK